MGTDCAPFVANLFLYSYEFEFLYNKLVKKEFSVLRLFNYTCRYIDDLVTINNDNQLKLYANEIYPPEMKLTSDSKNDLEVDYLDLSLEIDKKKLKFKCKLYDKRDKFPFTIVNFPHLDGNIPSNESYGVFISQVIRYARGCMEFEDFKSRISILVKKLISQHFKLHKLQSKYLKFCHKYRHLIFKYGGEVFSWKLTYSHLMTSVELHCNQAEGSQLATEGRRHASRFRIR